MKRNILLTFTGFCLAVAFFTPVREYLYNQKNVASPILDNSIPNKSLPEQPTLPESLSPYTTLPYKEFIFPPRRFLSFHGPSIVELPDGDLFVVWSRAMTWGYNGCIWGSRRPVGANKWTEPSIVHDTSGLDDKNPVLYLGQDKKLWLIWTLQHNQSKWHHGDIIRVKASNDFGYTWGKDYNFGTPVGCMSRAHPIRLHNGWLVLPIYMDWCASSAVVISKDDGLTWGKPKLILPFFGIEPTIIERSDLSLFALMRSGGPPRRSWQVASYDQGHSWGSWGISDINNPSSALEMIKLRNGHVAVIFNNCKKGRFNLSIALSYDDGKTWPHIKAIENQPGHRYGYPSAIQDRYGLIHVVYACDNQNVAHFVANEKWIEN